MPVEQNLLPLFPLELVLLPEEPLPLHIFEDRYKTMIAKCLEAKGSGRGQQEFGVVLLKEHEVSRVGCTAQIVNVKHRYEDGRMDIVTVGKRRFEILMTTMSAPTGEARSITSTTRVRIPPATRLRNWPLRVFVRP